MELGSVREWLSSVQNSRSNGLEGCALLFISLDILALGRSIPASSSTALLTAISGFWKQKQVRTNNPLRTRELKFTRLLSSCPTFSMDSSFILVCRHPRTLHRFECPFFSHLGSSFCIGGETLVIQSLTAEFGHSSRPEVLQAKITQKIRRRSSGACRSPKIRSSIIGSISLHAYNIPSPLS